MIHRLSALARASFMEEFQSRVHPTREEFESLSRAGAFDEFGETRTTQFWRIRMLTGNSSTHSGQQGWLFPTVKADRIALVAGQEPSTLQKLEWENDLFGFPATAHPLDLYPEVAQHTYCPVLEMGKYIGEEITTGGLIVEGRTFHQSNGEPMKFLSIADYTGIVETEMFAQSYRSYGLQTVRYPVLEITGRVEPFENGRGFSLRVLRAGKPRIQGKILTF